MIQGLILEHIFMGSAVYSVVLPAERKWMTLLRWCCLVSRLHTPDELTHSLILPAL